VEGASTGQSAQLDALDARLVTLLADQPRIGVLECARRLGVARGTVQARLDRLQARGVITGFGPDVDPGALGFVVSAFVTLEIAQGAGREGVVAHLVRIPEVLQVHTVTGQGDLLCRIVARSNADLQDVIDGVVAHPDIRRTATVIALATPVPYRVLPLVQQAVSRRTAPPSAG
jgi:DNA-binding Lrp family transcriptional regulator